MTKTTTKRRVSARDLGIEIGRKEERDLFHWLMCVILFSKPIQQEIAGEAFLRLKDHGYDTPDALRAAGWQEIVDVLGEAHYVRYDESTATRLLDATTFLIERYSGHVKELVTEAGDARSLRRLVQQIRGIGPKGAGIFLREVAPVYFHE